MLQDMESKWVQEYLYRVIRGVSTAEGGREHVLIEIQVKTGYAINRCRVTRTFP